MTVISGWMLKDGQEEVICVDPRGYIAQVSEVEKI